MTSKKSGMLFLPSARKEPGGRGDELLREVDLVSLLQAHAGQWVHRAVAQDIDMQISGHTHYGQLWPVNYIVNRIYELAWGYRKIGNTHFYVSDGAGTWGPPVRIGNRPEILNINLRFE